MARVSRLILTTSFLTAIPIVMLMVSHSVGDGPVGRSDETTYAAAPAHQPGAIRQVVGKQIVSSSPRRTSGSNATSPTTAPSLLGRIFGRRGQTAQPRREGPVLPTPPPIAADRSVAASRPQPRRQPAASSATTSRRPPTSRRPANTSAESARVPIRDPGDMTSPSQPSLSQAPTPNRRIIRGNPSAASTRRVPGGVATAKTDPQPNSTKIRRFSKRQSSRRSDRRAIDSLTTDAVTPEYRELVAGAKPTYEDTEDLVPKVSRRRVTKPDSVASRPAAATKKSSPTKIAGTPAVTAKPTTSEKKPASQSKSSKSSKSQLAGAKPAKKTPAAARPVESGLADASKVTKSSDRDAEIPTIGSTPTDVATPNGKVANATVPSQDLVGKRPRTATPMPTPQPTAVAQLAPPQGNFPAKPSSASDSGFSMPTFDSGPPAASASHRAGPPSSAFGPVPFDPQPYAGNRFATQQPAFGTDPHRASNQAGSRAAPSGQPVGSGIANQSSTIGDAPPAPVYEVATREQTSRSGWGVRGGLPRPAETGRPPMTTIGDPSDRSADHAGQKPGHSSAPDSVVSDSTSRRHTEVPNLMRPRSNLPARAFATPTQADGSPSVGSLESNRAGWETSNSPDGQAVASELPGIRVITRGPETMMIRQTAEYKILVENRGRIDAQGVVIRASVPEWADVESQSATRGGLDRETKGGGERFVWTIDELPAGKSETMFLRLTATQSGDYELDVDWTLMPRKTVAQITVRQPKLQLAIEGPDQITYGESKSYKVRVLNPGDGVAPNVVFILSPDSTPQTQRIGDIPPGKEAQFDVELTAQDLADLRIKGLATGDLGLRATADKTIRVLAADLQATLTGPELKYQNSEAMYAVEIKNDGLATSRDITATLRLPAGARYQGGIDQATNQGNMLKWTIDSLAPGATKSYQYRCSLISTGQHVFTLDARGSAAGATDVSLATEVESIADLVLSINDPPAPAPIGSEVTYEIVIRNRGSREAKDVRAIAQFSHGIEPQRISGGSGEVVTGQVLFDPIVRIGAGQEVRLQVVALAEQGGHHRFRTEVKSGDTVLVAEEATHYMNPRSERVSRHSSHSVK